MDIKSYEWNRMAVQGILFRRELSLSIIIGAIDCLVGLMAVHVNKTAEWWVVDRMHGKGGTYDTVIGDVVGG